VQVESHAVGLSSNNLGNTSAASNSISFAIKIASAQFWCQKGGVYGIGDAFGCLGKTKMFKHHGTSPDLTNRVGNALASDIRCRAMNWFK